MLLTRCLYLAELQVEFVSQVHMAVRQVGSSPKLLRNENNTSEGSARSNPASMSRRDTVRTRADLVQVRDGFPHPRLSNYGFHVI